MKEIQHSNSHSLVEILTFISLKKRKSLSYYKIFKMKTILLDSKGFVRKAVNNKKRILFA